VATAAVVATLAGCGDDAPSRPDAAAFEGAWDVSLVVGSVDADPGADPATLPGDTTYRERWVFEDCDEQGCLLRRPDGGLLLGDLDEVDFAFTEASTLDDQARFTGEGEAATIPRPAEAGEHADDAGEGEGDVEVADDEHCVGSATRRWAVRIEVDVRDEVLSGTVLRRPEARQEVVEGLTCFGIDLTLGFSGVPAAAGAATGDG
jgi:hypothetical protein